MGAPVGNSNASRGAQIRSQINAAFSRRDDKLGKPDGATLRELMDNFVAEALENAEVRSELFDRLYGKPTQAVDLGNTDGEPFRTIAWPLPQTPLDK